MRVKGSDFPRQQAPTILERGLERIGLMVADNKTQNRDDPRHQRHPRTENVGASPEEATNRTAEGFHSLATRNDK
jgi:hypothetical protein